MIHASDQTGGRLGPILISLGASIAITSVKFYAYWLTGSAAIMSDALESIINVVASGFATWSILFSQAPPDENHPYGHGSVEYFSAGFEGGMILLAAMGIIGKAWSSLIHPEPIEGLGLGLWLLAATSLVNLAVGLLLVHRGRRTGSLALTADGQHLLTDVYTTIGVIVGLGLVLATGLTWLDGLTALAVAASIIATGARLVRQSFAGLMHETDPDLLAQVCEVLTAHRKPTWIDVHRLRAWRSGDMAHIDFHLIMPRDMRLDQVHDEMLEIESHLKTRFGRVEVLVHTDPCDVDMCETCAQDPCNFRSQPAVLQRPWTVPETAQDRDHAVDREE